ncbi:hypothetical protein [Streptomyces sp. NPDC047042]|uniref:hypothetical protein n=1 Tax=Streptomyces sp. NPDC047042 TaxID=3154807 RepID=UPI0033E10A03
MPVGEVVAGTDEVAADDAQMLVGEVAQPGGGVRVGCGIESVVEVGCGVQDLPDRGEDPVVRGGQLGERVGRVLRVVAWRRRSERWATEDPSGR